LRRTEKQHVISPRFAVGIIMEWSMYNVALNWQHGQQRPKKSLGTRQVAWHWMASMYSGLGEGG